MKNYTETESLDILINAVQKYQEDLAENQQILINAANVCDVAMGNDEIVKKHIARLNETLEELNKTSRIAADVAKALLEDKRKALDVYED